MNILDRIEARFAETKSACKLYATPASATKAAEREVAQLNKAHGTDIDLANRVYQLVAHCLALAHRAVVAAMDAEHVAVWIGD